MCIWSLPAGVVASIPSPRQTTNAMPSAWSSSSRMIRCRRLRAARSGWIAPCTFMVVRLRACSTWNAYATIDTRVDRWSSGAELDRLINALTTKGIDNFSMCCRIAGEGQLPRSGPARLGHSLRASLRDRGRRRARRARGRSPDWLSRIGESAALDQLSVHDYRDAAQSRRRGRGPDVARDEGHTGFELQPVLLTEVKRTSSFN